MSHGNPSGSSPFVALLGTAQDGGIPQVGCRCARCAAARTDASMRRMASSLLIADPLFHTRHLIDATPSFPEQVEHAERFLPRTTDGVSRQPLFDGILLSHAHIGHYAGLMYLGRETYAARGQRVHATESMGAFLRANGPWGMLIAQGNISLERLDAGATLHLSERVSILPFAVPHRGEYSDTCGYVIEGPGKRVLYVPDTDTWGNWTTPIEEWIASVDIALLDGTFYDNVELRGRSVQEIPHPRISQSIARLSAMSAVERRKIHFIHLNHTNNAADVESLERHAVHDAEMHIGRDGERFWI